MIPELSPVIDHYASTGSKRFCRFRLLRLPIWFGFDLHVHASTEIAAHAVRQKIISDVLI